MACPCTSPVITSCVTHSVTGAEVDLVSHTASLGQKSDVWEEHGWFRPHTAMWSIPIHACQARCFPTQLPIKAMVHLATVFRRPLLQPDWIYFSKYFTVPLDTASFPAQPDSLRAPSGSAPVHWGLEVVLVIKSKALCMLEKGSILELTLQPVTIFICACGAQKS